MFLLVRTKPPQPTTSSWDLTDVNDNNRRSKVPQEKSPAQPMVLAMLTGEQKQVPATKSNENVTVVFLVNCQQEHKLMTRQLN